MWCAVFLSLIVASANAAIETEDNVLVLTETNFEEAIAEHEFILVKFYAPWCGHCKAMAGAYADAATKLKESGSPVKIGKVDATVHSSVGQKFEVRGYPTLKFFKKGTPIEYSAGRTAEDIINFVNKKSGPAAKTLVTADEVKAFKESAGVNVLGCFKDKDGEEAKIFLSVASAFDDHQLAMVHDEAICEGNDGQITLFKDFDEGKTVFEGPLTEENFKAFVSSNALPLIVEFNHQTAAKIFSGDVKSHMLIFLSKESGHFDKYLDNVRPVAKANKGKILFVTVDTDEEDHGRILEFFGMDKKEVPGVRIIKLEEDMAKFKPEIDAELSTDSISKAVENFFAGEMKQHFLSETLPEDWDKQPVKVLVATNFDSVALDKEKDVLVEFYAPWCGHCKQLVPIYDAVAAEVADDPSIVVAKMDATQNELEHTKVQSFPTLKLYKKETNEVVDYDGERTKDAIVNFLRGKEEVPEEEEEETSEEVPAKEEL